MSARRSRPARGGFFLDVSDASGDPTPVSLARFERENPELDAADLREVRALRVGEGLAISRGVRVRRVAAPTSRRGTSRRDPGGPEGLKVGDQFSYFDDGRWTVTKIRRRGTPLAEVDLRRDDDRDAFGKVVHDYRSVRARELTSDGQGWRRLTEADPWSRRDRRGASRRDPASGGTSRPTAAEMVAEILATLDPFLGHRILRVDRGVHLDDSDGVFVTYANAPAGSGQLAVLNAPASATISIADVKKYGPAAWRHDAPAPEAIMAKQISGRGPKMRAKTGTPRQVLAHVLKFFEQNRAALTAGSEGALRDPAVRRDSASLRRDVDPYRAAARQAAAIDRKRGRAPASWEWRATTSDGADLSLGQHADPARARKAANLRAKERGARVVSIEKVTYSGRRDLGARVKRFASRQVGEAKKILNPYAGSRAAELRSLPLAEADRLSDDIVRYRRLTDAEVAAHHDNWRRASAARRGTERDPTRAKTARGLARHVAREYQRKDLTTIDLKRDYGFPDAEARAIYHLAGERGQTAARLEAGIMRVLERAARGETSRDPARAETKMARCTACKRLVRVNKLGYSVAHGAAPMKRRRYQAGFVGEYCPGREVER